MSMIALPETCQLLSRKKLEVSTNIKRQPRLGRFSCRKESGSRYVCRRSKEGQDFETPVAGSEKEEEKALNERIKLLMGGLETSLSTEAFSETEGVSTSVKGNQLEGFSSDELWWEQGKKIVGRRNRLKYSGEGPENAVNGGQNVLNTLSLENMELVWSRRKKDEEKLSSTSTKPEEDSQGNNNFVGEAPEAAVVTDQEISISDPEIADVPLTSSEEKNVNSVETPLIPLDGIVSEVLTERIKIQRWTKKPKSRAPINVSIEPERPLGASTTGIPLLSSRNPVPYQKLKINLDLKLYEARNLGRRGRVEEAEKLFRDCIRDWPDDGKAYVSLGKLLVSQGRRRDARQVYEEGCQAVGGESAHLWQAWAFLEQKLGNTSRARTLFDAATAADKTHGPAWHGWAILELKAGNTAKARELLTRGVRLTGGTEFLFHSLGTMEVKAGRTKEAKEFFVRATKCSKSSSASWMSWALLEAEEGNVDAARTLFKRALQISPRSRYVYQSWALFEARLGRSKEARKLFVTGTQLNPRDSALPLTHALFEYENKLPDKARKLFQLASQADPRDGCVWRAWGWMEWKEGQVEKARELYRRAIAVDPNSVRCYQAWGVLEEREGNTGLARELFKQAIKVEPGNIPTLKAWIAMEEKLGNVVRAEELKLLCEQQGGSLQKGEGSWDVSELVGPAFARMRSLFSFDISRRTSAQRIVREADPATILSETESEDEEDLDSFLRSKIYKKLPPPSLQKIEKRN